MVYFDNAATTKMDPRVFDAMVPYLSSLYFNPSSLYKESRSIKNELEKSRSAIGKLIHADSDEIIFTSCGTEANNMVIKGVALQLQDKGKHLITSQVEHHSVLNTFKWLETQGFKVTYLPVNDQGSVEPETLLNAICTDTILISLMWVNNETGAIFDIEALSSIAKRSNVLFHTDAVQALKTETINVKAMDVDFLTLSGHKIHGPKGIGALYCAKNHKLMPLIHGGKQESGQRAGTESVANIIGFGKAAEILYEEKKEMIEAMSHLKHRFVEKINDFEGVIINGDLALSTPAIINIGFSGVEAEPIVILMNRKDVCLSMGAACNSDFIEPSHVLRAMHVSKAYIEGCIRVSFGKFNTVEEVDYLTSELLNVVTKLRAYEK